MKKFQRFEVLRSGFSFTMTGFLFSIGVAYSSLIIANFIIELLLFYYFPDSHISHIDPEPAQTIVEAAEQAKDETIQFATRRPIQLAVVSFVLGIGVFIILYGFWEE